MSCYRQSPLTDLLRVSTSVQSLNVVYEKGQSIIQGRGLDKLPQFKALWFRREYLLNLQLTLGTNLLLESYDGDRALREDTLR